jgi:hypothetical protein
MSMKSALRRLSRAFSTKDERAFDEALEELEEKMEDKKDKSHDGEEDPASIGVRVMKRRLPRGSRSTRKQPTLGSRR